MCRAPLLVLALLLAQVPEDGLGRTADSLGAGCNLPSSFLGVWFQSGVRPYVTVDPDGRVSTKGRCVEADARGGGRFVFQDEGAEGGHECFRCLVIHQRAKNVLQYKETFGCSPSRDPSVLCSEISGDAPLYWLFRADGAGVDCPFFAAPSAAQSSSLSFSYDRGKGHCQSPPSSLRRCTTAGAVAMHYQACPNVPGSEMTAESLECRAVWREGSHHFLLGRVGSVATAEAAARPRSDGHHSSSLDDESSLRCFAFAPVNALLPAQGFRMARSADATCNGIYSPTEGPTLYQVKQAEDPLASGCVFPSWMTDSADPRDGGNGNVARERGRRRQQPRRPTVWKSLDGDVVIKSPSPSNSSRLLHVYESARSPPSSSSPRSWWRSSSPSSPSSPSGPAWLSCHRRVEAKSPHGQRQTFVAVVTRGCESGYVCVEMRRANQNVIFLRRGSLSRAADYACDQDHFGVTSNTAVTMLLLQGRARRRRPPSPEQRGLPVPPGLYAGVGAAADPSFFSSPSASSSSSSLAAAVSKQRKGGRDGCHHDDDDDDDDDDSADRGDALQLAFGCRRRDLLVKWARQTSCKSVGERAQAYKLLEEWSFAEDEEMEGAEAATTEMGSHSPSPSPPIPRRRLARYLIYKASPSSSPSSSSAAPFCLRLLLPGEVGSGAGAGDAVVMTRLDQHCQRTEDGDGDEGRKMEMVLAIKGDCTQVSFSRGSKTAAATAAATVVPLLLFIGLLNLSLFDG